MNSLAESFYKGFEMSHRIEGDKREKIVAKQQADLYRMQMMKYAQEMLETKRKLQTQQGIKQMLLPQDMPGIEIPGVAPTQIQSQFGQTFNMPGIPDTTLPPTTQPSPLMQGLQQGYGGPGAQAIGQMVGTGVPLKEAAGIFPKVTEKAPKAPTQFGVYYKAQKALGKTDAKIVEGFKELGKGEAAYPKGFNEMLGKLQTTQGKIARLESGMSEFGFEFKITANIKRALGRLKEIETRQRKFMKKRFPEEWKDYGGGKTALVPKPIDDFSTLWD